MNFSVKSIFLAIRIKTLAASISPVIIGSSLAFSSNIFSHSTFYLTLFSALFIQIGTNFINDVYDFIKGADNEKRLGPPRAVQSNLISESAMIKYGFISFILAVLCGFPLVYIGGWPILLIGVLSIFSGYFYTAGPYPLGYNGWGDVFVFIFFGPVAVCGTYYLQTFNISLLSLLCGIILGSLSTCLLCVNNIRDVENDAISGKRTIAVRISVKFVQFIFVILLLTVNIINIYIYILLSNSNAILPLYMFILYYSYKLSKDVFYKKGIELNNTLQQVSILIILITIALLFSILA